MNPALAFVALGFLGGCGEDRKSEPVLVEETEPLAPGPAEPPGDAAVENPRALEAVPAPLVDVVIPELMVDEEPEPPAQP